MYKDYYHLTSEPFPTHPATDTFFISSTHKEAWYYLLFGIDTREPFIVLTGEYGMGKTLLCLQLLKMAKAKGMSRVEYIPTTNEGFGGILRRMATTMGISPLPENEEILQDMVYDRFRAEDGQSRFYLIIDDAHELDASTLTKLKHLSTFSYDEFFPVVMIFVAHPSFLQDLKTPALSSLNQRIKRRYHLSRFNLEDTKNYIYYRLLKSGGTGVPSFSDQAIRNIFEYSGGIPRLINNICDACLLIGASNQLISISPAVVAEAKKLVEGSLVHTAETGVETEDSSYKLLTDKNTSGRREVDDDTVKADLSSNRMVTDAGEPEINRHEESPSVTRIKKVILIVLAAILVMAVVALLSEFLMKDRRIFTLFTPGAGIELKQLPEETERADGKALTWLSDGPTDRAEAQAAPVYDERSPERTGAKAPPLSGNVPAKPMGQPLVQPSRTTSMPSLPAAYR